MKKPIATALSLVLLAAACAAPARAGSTKDPVRRLGKTVTQYRDDVVQAVLGTRWAAAHHAEDRWTFFELALRAGGGKPVVIDREDVSLTFPDGTKVNMPSQKRMAEGVKDVRWLMQKAAVSRDPIDGYFSGVSGSQRLGFFAVPGEAITFDEVTVNRELMAQGDVFFESPTGKFPPGDYVLSIENKQVRIELPFSLPARDWPEKKGDGTVAW